MQCQSMQCQSIICNQCPYGTKLLNSNHYFCMMPHCVNPTHINATATAMIKKFCNHSGCQTLVDYPQKYCETHQPLSNRVYRKKDSPSERGYDTQWKRVRIIKLQHEPLCEDCLERNKTVPAVEVHHIIKIKTDSNERLNMDNLKSLCEKCHKVRTGRGE